jgi:hypothetical protein
MSPVLKPRLIRWLLPDHRLKPIHRRKRVVLKNADLSSATAGFSLSTARSTGYEPRLRAVT